MKDKMRVRGSTIGGVFLIGLGILFLAGQFLGLDVWRYLWPFFIIGFGLLFFAGMLAAGRGSDAGALAIPGSLFVMLGLIFLYQTIFNHWASWAYIWSLLAPTSIGIGLLIYAWWSNRPQLRQTGLILVTIGVIIFVVLGGFFELIIGFAGIQTPGRILWPVMLILLGILLLVGRSFRLLSFSHADSVSTAVSVDASPSGEASKPNNTEPPTHS
jgi:hypothetical protein